MPRTSRQLLTGLPVPPHPHPVVFFKPCTSFSWAPEKTQTGGPLVTARAHFPVTPRALCSCHQRGMCPSCSYFMSPPASAGLLACCPPPARTDRKYALCLFLHLSYFLALAFHISPTGNPPSSPARAPNTARSPLHRGGLVPWAMAPRGRNVCFPDSPAPRAHALRHHEYSRFSG